MHKLSPAIRKAAILVSTLDERAADALLAQMGDEPAARVRSAVVELDEIPATEVQAVLAEFLAGQATATRDITSDESGVELDFSFADHDSAGPAAELAALQPERVFAFLENVYPAETARLLAREGAQTVAVVIAQLDAQLAALILEALPSDLATEALERLACLHEPAADVLAEIAEHLQRALAPIASPDSQAASLSGIRALLAAMDATVRERVLTGLQHRNWRLAEQLGHRQERESVGLTRFRVESSQRGVTPAPLVEFEDLLTLSDEALRRVFAAADPQVVLLALTGAPEALLTRILSQLPPNDAATLRKRLNCPGPVRLSDIATAQEELAAVARRLAERGTIALQGSRHFAAAA